MNEHDLYCAIGNVDEAFLLECENRPIRRIPKRFGLIAAIVALMLTACAPAAIRAFNALKSGNISPSEVRYTGRDIYVVGAQVEISPSAPYTIQTYYFPAAMEPYLEGGTYVLSEHTFSLRCNTAEKSECEILFVQGAFTKERRIEEEQHVLTFPSHYDSAPQVSMATYGEIQALEFDVKLTNISVPEGFITVRNLCWSDGLYLYFLQVPESWSKEQITEMVNGLKEMKDISAYPVTEE